MKKGLVMFLFLVSGLLAFAQDDIGSGRAILFDGIDDYIDLGNIYDDVALPITISAWIYIEPNSDIVQLPIFDSQDNSSVYNGFTFFSSTLPHIGFTYGDGKGGNNPAFRRSRAGYFQTMGEWIYVTAIARTGSDINMYMNGHNVSGDYQGSSTYPMNSNSPGEVAKIGYMFSNGITYHFKGIIDELRIWNRALSELEIRDTMCKKLKGDEVGLIGYWTFDETSGDILKDLSAKQFHGQLKGNPTRVYSGAPVGDESVFLYSSDWSGKSLSMGDLSVTNVSGSPYGVHIYQVNRIPSQTGGLDVTLVHNPYYGVFLADDDEDNVFDVSFTPNTACKYFQRKDNRESTWSGFEMFSGNQHRVEIIPSSEGTDFEVNLGADHVVCDETSKLLDPNVSATGKTFRWNTGETSPTLVVTSSGEFSVEVKEGCKVGRDTLTVTFLQTPLAFSLGEDEVFCPFESRVLITNVENDGYEFTWQDGSKETTFEATDYGTYWLKIQNACGTAIDSVTFSRYQRKNFTHYNFISPDNDDDLNQYFVLDEMLTGAGLTVFNRWGKAVYQSLHYQNDWDGAGLPSGIYFYTVHDACMEPQKGTLTIMR